jgi:hypothetical protein
MGFSARKTTYWLFPLFFVYYSQNIGYLQGHNLGNLVVAEGADMESAPTVVLVMVLGFWWAPTGESVISMIPCMWLGIMMCSRRAALGKSLGISYHNLSIISPRRIQNHLPIDNLTEQMRAPVHGNGDEATSRHKCARLYMAMAIKQHPACA